MEVQPQSGGIKLVVDRGVVRATIYQLVFTDSKLVLKRLSSANVTIILPLMLAVVGFLFLFIIGALIGGITGFSLQEFLTQRMRNKIESEAAPTTVGPGDIEIRYGDLSEVRLGKNRLFLLSETNSFAASLPRRYSGRVSPVLARIFGSKFRTEESLSAAKAAEKEDEERHHPGSDRGKLSRR